MSKKAPSWRSFRARREPITLSFGGKVTTAGRLTKRSFSEGLVVEPQALNPFQGRAIFERAFKRYIVSDSLFLSLRLLYASRHKIFPSLSGDFLQLPFTTEIH